MSFGVLYYDILTLAKRWNNLPSHDSNDIAFVDFLSPRMISEGTQIITELFEVLVSSLSNGRKDLFAYYC